MRCLLALLVALGGSVVALAPAQAALVGGVTGWGDDSSGQQELPAGLGDVAAVSAGHMHGLALRADTTVAAWGSDTQGQTQVPVGLAHVTAVSAGGFHSLALKDSGRVVAWGWNAQGQTDVPAGLTDVSAVDAGVIHNLALRPDGTVAAWGWNAQGQTDVPAGLTDVVAVSAGYLHSLALRSDGTVAAWGWNAHGQTDVPAGLTDVVAVSAGYLYNLALRSDGTVVAWGWNGHGQADVPAGLADVTAVAAGNAHSLALTSDGTVVAWGFNGQGQADVPAGLSDVAAIDASGNHSLALDSLRSTQSIAWRAPRARVAGSEVELSGTATSGLPLRYGVSSSTKHGVCSVSGTTLQLTRPGDCVVHADQDGDAAHAPARRVTRTVAVNHAPAMATNRSWVVRDRRFKVLLTGAEPGQRYRIRFLRGRVLAEGTVPDSGTVVRRLRVPQHARLGPRTVKVRLLAPRWTLTAPVRVVPRR